MSWSLTRRADSAAPSECELSVKSPAKYMLPKGRRRRSESEFETRASDGPCGDGARMVSVEAPTVDEGPDAGKELFERFLEPGLGVVQRARSRVEALGRRTMDQQIEQNLPGAAGLSIGGGAGIEHAERPSGEKWQSAAPVNGPEPCGRGVQHDMRGEIGAPALRLDGLLVFIRQAGRELKLEQPIERDGHDGGFCAQAVDAGRRGVDGANLDAVRRLDHMRDLLVEPQPGLPQIRRERLDKTLIASNDVMGAGAGRCEDMPLGNAVEGADALQGRADLRLQSGPYERADTEGSFWPSSHLPKDSSLSAIMEGGTGRCSSVFRCPCI